MPVVNPLARELVFKIVYYGPGLGGKTTTLQYIHAKTKTEHRGKMVSLATPVDRTLYFDFLPIRVPDVRTLSVRLQLFTVPGQVYYNATRKLVLTGADGVVMVADSGTTRADSNLESLDNLLENLKEHGRDLAELPHVFQYNKRDLKDALPLEELDQSLNRFSAPWFPTVATRGEGLFEALEAITRAVLAEFEHRIPEGDDSARGLELPEGGLAEALRAADTELLKRSLTPVPPRYRPSGTMSLGLPDKAPGEVAARAVADSLPVRSEPPRERVTRRPRGEEGAERKAERGPSPEEQAPQAEGAREEGERRAPEALAQRAPERSERDPRATAPRAGLEALTLEGEDDANEPIALSRPRTQPPAAPTFSFATLWPANERGIVAELEDALARADYERAVARAEQLVSRSLASAAGILGTSGEAPRDPAVVTLLLGIEGRRYLEFRALVRDARSGRAVQLRDALHAFAFAVDVRMARARVEA